MERHFVVVNPVAANGSVGRNWSALRAVLDAALGDYDYQMTEGPEHATKLARQALNDGYESIGSLGGDGTHSQVANGFFDESGEPIRPESTLSILPVGTGGDFRRALEVEGKDMARWARRMSEPEATPIDIGRVSYTADDGQTVHQHFLNIASFGVSGLVDRKVNDTTKALGGRASFFIGSVRAIAGYRPAAVRLTVDGERVLSNVPLFVGAVCNGQYFGGGMHVAPQARLDDGQFDVVVIEWRGRLKHLLTGTRIYSGAHLDLPFVRVVRGRQVQAEANAECLIDLDGEAPGRLPATFSLVPGAVRLKGVP